jgi:hypothetical protein
MYNMPRLSVAEARKRFAHGATIRSRLVSGSVTFAIGSAAARTRPLSPGDPGVVSFSKTGTCGP